LILITTKKHQQGSDNITKKNTHEHVFFLNILSHCNAFWYKKGQSQVFSSFIQLMLIGFIFFYEKILMLSDDACHVDVVEAVHE